MANAIIYDPSTDRSCPICHQAIFRRCGGCKQWQPLPNHCQFRVHYGPSFATDIAMCKQCFKRVTDEQIAEVFEQIKDYWAKTGFAYPKEADVRITQILRETVW